MPRTCLALSLLCLGILAGRAAWPLVCLPSEEALPQHSSRRPFPPLQGRHAAPWTTSSCGERASSGSGQLQREKRAPQPRVSYLPRPSEGWGLGAQHGMELGLNRVLVLPPAHTSSLCRDISEGTRELAGVACGVDKDPWAPSGPTDSPYTQVVVHTVYPGQRLPASRPTSRMPRQPATYIPG